MTSEPINYSPLLPQDLGPKLRDATAEWHTVNASQDAILMPLFTGVKGFQPNVFAVRNTINTIGKAPISLCQDISSYGQLFTSIVGAVKDRQTLATSLQVLVNRWHVLDTGELTSAQSETASLLRYDALAVKKVLLELENLAKLILTWTSTSTDSIFDSTLFDLVSRILDPIANFPSTTDGIARLADSLHLPIRAINVPLKKVFQKPLIGSPTSTPEVVSSAVSALQEVVRDYFSRIDKVLDNVGALVRFLDAVASNALLIPKGVEDFATGKSHAGAFVDAATAEKAWTEAGSAADGFVKAISGGSSTNAHASFSVRAFAASQHVPTTADVEKDLGPPSYGASELASLANQTIQTSTQLTSVLTLPYNNQLKVTVDDVEISLFEAVLNTKTSYQDIQNRTIPVVRDIQTYSLIQKTVLPVLQSNLGISSAELFRTWTILAASYGAQATQVANDCQSLLGKFEKDVDVLRSNLKEVKARIAEDKEELNTAQREYDHAKAQLLIDGILTALLTAGAIAAAYAGEGELVEKLGGKAEETLSQLIETELKADELMLLIHNIERIISLAENTSDQLDKAIPLLVGVVRSMTQIGNVWADTTTSLASAQNEYSAWTDAKLLTPELLSRLASRWATYENEALNYVNSVIGVTAPVTANLLSIAISGVSEKDFNSATFGTPMDTDSKALRKFYELDNDPKLRAFVTPTTLKEHVEKFQVLQAGALDSQLYNALKAPALYVGTNRQSLLNSAQAYLQSANIMESQFPQGANDSRDLAARINNDVLPSVTEVVDFYKNFADRQVASLSETPTKSTLEQLSRENAALAAQGNTKAKAAQVVVLDFKNRSVLVNNAVIQKINELQMSYDIAQRTLADKKDELAKYDWVQWWPFPPGIGLIVKAIVEAITHTEEDIRNIGNQINYIQQARAQMDAARSVDDACLQTVVSLTQSWANVTQETNDLGAYLNLISEVPATAPALADSAKETWQSLNRNLAQW